MRSSGIALGRDRTQFTLVIRKTTLLIAATVLSAICFTGLERVSAQAVADRRVVERAGAAYPDLAQRMHLQGTVKLAVTVRATGDVKSSRPLGGNPVLIDAATAAARKWRFEPAQGETTEVIEFRFGAH
jgi:TonB family protein